MVKDWAHAQGRIHDLYVVQQRPLHKVISLMRDHHGFTASPRAYKIKFKQWGYEKKKTDVQHRSRSNGQRSKSTVNVMSVSEPYSNTTAHILSSSDLLPGLATEPVTALSNSESWSLPLPSSYPVQNGQNDQQQNPYTPLSGSSTYHHYLNDPIFQSGQTDDDINRQDSDGQTRLHRSVVKGSLQEVDDLLSLGASLDIRDLQQNQPIHYAASRPLEDILRCLLRRGANINAKGQAGRTPLHISIPYPNTFKFLLRMKLAVSAQDDQGDTPLHLALLSTPTNTPTERSTIGKLILAGADVNVRNNVGITPFRMILEKKWQKGNYGASFLIMFLEHGALISERTADGRLPFDIFLENSEFRWVKYESSYSKRKLPNEEWNLDFKLFLSKGADPNTRLKSGETLINEALNRSILSYGHDQDLGVLLCKSVNIENAGLQGNYPLHCLLRHMPDNTLLAIELVKDFLGRGADPNQANEAGEPPLIILLASAWGWDPYQRVDLVDLLIQSGANPMQRDLKNELPIYVVARKLRYSDNRNKLLKSLLESGRPYDVASHTNQSGQTRSPEQIWWETYYRAYHSNTWSSPIHLVGSSRYLPADVSELISSFAVRLLAEKFLSSWRASFVTLKETQGLHSPHTRSASNQFAAILRDCRELKIDVEQDWYYFLLEMFDQEPEFLPLGDV